PAMLAGMLAAACCYRRYLDGDGRGWWLLALLAGGLGALFKYYGLMVLIPLADMERRRDGWRACCRLRFLVLVVGIFVPVALWTLAIFDRNPNPSRGGIYFLFQQPSMLLDGVLYERLIERFLWKDCGPFTMLFLVIGIGAVLMRRKRATPVYAWTLMGLLFYFLLGPKLDRHDYYELMMLPAASIWAALGWQTTSAALSPRWAWCGVAALFGPVIVKPPLVMPANFRLKPGLMFLTRGLKNRFPPAGRIVVIGPDWCHSVVHYSRREGWVLAEE